MVLQVDTGSDVQEWIYEKIIHSTLPFQNAMLDLIEEYVDNIFQFPHITAIPEAMISIHFYTIPRYFEPYHIFFFFYILCYSNKILCLTPNNSQKPPKRYSSELLDTLPSSQILRWVENEPGYGNVYPKLIGLMDGVMKHLLDVMPVLLVDEERSTNKYLIEYHDIKRMVDSKTSFLPLENRSIPPHSYITYAIHAVKEALNNPGRAISALHWIHDLSPIISAKYCVNLIQAALPNFLDQRLAQDVLDIFEKVWCKLNVFAPQIVWTTTINSTRMAEDSTKEDYTYRQIIQTPLLLFRCDKRVFMSPPIYRIFLLMLRGILVASRQLLETEFHCFMVYQVRRLLKVETIDSRD